jgi:uncharacterized protein YjiS (DUF1127 family)
MMYLIRSLRDAAAKRAAYRRTVRELSNLPIDTALDLDIYQGDAAKIAHQAVYGA